MSGKNTTTPAKQDGFKSQWGFIMAAVGSCVGMANVWRFPMLVSRYGGLTFLIPYFIFAIVISQSGMMEEFSLGRWAGYGPVGSFGKDPTSLIGIANTFLPAVFSEINCNISSI